MIRRTGIEQQSGREFDTSGGSHKRPS